MQDQAFASSFSVSPVIVTLFDNQFPIIKQLTLTNLSDHKEDLEAQLMPIKQDTDGNPILMSASEADRQTKQLLSYITISQPNFSLVPEETKTLEVTLSSQSAKILNRDYYFSILFVSKDNYKITSAGHQVKATVLQEPMIASLFLISTMPAEKNKLQVKIVSPSVFFTNMLTPKISIANNGQSLANMTLHYKLTNLFGRSDIDNNTHAYVFADSSRSLSLLSILLPTSIISFEKLSLNLADSQSGTNIELSQNILIIPIVFDTVLILCLILTFFLIKRVRARLENQKNQN